MIARHAGGSTCRVTLALAGFMPCHRLVCRHPGGIWRAESEWVVGTRYVPTLGMALAFAEEGSQR